MVVFRLRFTALSEYCHSNGELKFLTGKMFHHLNICLMRQSTASVIEVRLCKVLWESLDKLMCLEHFLRNLQFLKMFIIVFI